MIRRAKKEDSPALYDLLLEILQDMELAILEIIPPQELKQLFVDSMQEEVSRYSYNNCLVFEENNEILGLCYGYKGELEHQFNHSLQNKLIEYGLSPELSLFPDAETGAGEWYLDSLVTKKGHRGEGIAQTLMQALPDIALEEGEKVIGLICDQKNPKARSLYERLGYKVVASKTVSGHQYDHMQKVVG